MQARNPDKQSAFYTDSNESRDWLLDTEDELFESSEEVLPPVEEGGVPLRREKRERVFRAAEYSPYPRVGRDQRRLTAFVRNESLSGMCLVSDQTEPVGSCLHVAVEAVDGLPTKETLARVVWTCQQADGRHWLGLSLLNPRSARCPEESLGQTADSSAEPIIESPNYNLITSRLDQKAS